MSISHLIYISINYLECNLITLCALVYIHVFFQLTMYSLIEFLLDNGQKPEVEVVPNVWLYEKEGKWYCLWPQTMPKKLIRKAIEKAYLPKEDWVKYNCRLLHTCGKFFLFYKKNSL